MDVEDVVRDQFCNTMGTTTDGPAGIKHAYPRAH